MRHLLTCLFLALGLVASAQTVTPKAMTIGTFWYAANIYIGCLALLVLIAWVLECKSSTGSINVKGIEQSIDNSSGVMSAIVLAAVIMSALSVSVFAVRRIAELIQ